MLQNWGSATSMADKGLGVGVGDGQIQNQA